LLCFWAGVVFSAGLPPASKMPELPPFFLSPRFKWESLGSEAWSLEKEPGNEPGQG